ncbi:MAG: hypothetical protein ACRCXY_00925 [Fusobacteriaceae bacterium]
MKINIFIQEKCGSIIEELLVIIFEDKKSYVIDSQGILYFRTITKVAIPGSKITKKDIVKFQSGSIFNNGYKTVEISPKEKLISLKTNKIFSKNIKEQIKNLNLKKYAEDNNSFEIEFFIEKLEKKQKWIF